MFDGLEIDMLSLGDADCIVVTHWSARLGAQRILIDGGNASDFPAIKGFLLSRGMKDFWAVVCTHLHGDHAGGLIRLVQDTSFTFQTGWMHDIRNHLSSDALRRACAGNSPQVDGVREVRDNTKALASAFEGRGLQPQEPFAGSPIAGFPAMTVLGPDASFYKQTIEEFTKVEVPGLAAMLQMLAGGGPGRSVPLSSLYAPVAPAAPYANLYAPATVPSNPWLSSFAGVLKNSSVEESPSTQPYNNTSVILGVVFNGQRFMFTADAGRDALDRVPPEWRNLQGMQIPHHGSDGNLSQTNVERFCPKIALISARGSTDHPSRAIVNGLIKVGAQVCSTHSNPGHLWYWSGAVPARPDYGQPVLLKGTSNRVAPSLGWLDSLPAR